MAKMVRVMHDGLPPAMGHSLHIPRMETNGMPLPMLVGLLRGHQMWPMAKMVRVMDNGLPSV